MPSEVANLDIEVFQHPLFSDFILNFKNRLVEETIQLNVEPSSDLDGLIQWLANKDKSRLLTSLECATIDTCGVDQSKLPYDRLSDNIISFSRFVMTQRRAPKTQLMFNDVLYHIKTSNEILNPLRVFVTDKELVKIFVKALVGDQYNIPTLRVLRRASELKNFEFPEVCCVKPTHMSGEVEIMHNSATVDYEKMCRWFDMNYYHSSREANYATLRPKIIVEQFIEAFYELRVFCFHGKARLIKTNVDRLNGIACDFFDTDWNELPIRMDYPKYHEKISRPKNYREIIEIAEQLGQHFNFIRIDIYSDNDRVYVGEITNCDNSASSVFQPEGAHEQVSILMFG